MNYVKVLSKSYIKCEDILSKAPIWSKPSRTTRDLIKKKNIPESDFIYARETPSGTFVLSDGKSNRYDKVLLDSKYEELIPELNKKNRKIIVDDSGIEKAPDIIELEDSEKFKDEKGSPLDIETRGEREPDKIFFKVKDVSSVFEIDRLQDVILDEHKNYSKDIHYKYLISENPTNSGKKTSKELFLTYEG